ncbi:PREDICTED: agamous-like MADS-box protein AGL103 [Tarenaya hassleriana]|uniref:agamous-like MADS-box protein AGL103 n=2 Tax=Tarenaya hassleriana TaxID=28532 RepID=UPI00053C4C86|nr:PREDICTED: agamous-like MADS-box protein AGL103 [Tarenaya hassleriana]
MASKKPRSKESKAKETAFAKRVQTLKNKARELSVLCDISVCFICYGPDGQLYHWPENPGDVRTIATSYRALSEENRRKRTVDLNAFLASENSKTERPKKKRRLASEEPVCDEASNQQHSREDLRVLLSRIDSKLEEFHGRLSQKMVRGEQPRGFEGFSGKKDTVFVEPEATPILGEENRAEIDVFGGLADLDMGFEGFGHQSSCFGFGDCLLEMDPTLFATDPVLQFEQIA